MAEAFCKLTFRSSACSGARLSTTSRVACGEVWFGRDGEDRPILQTYSQSHFPATHRPADGPRSQTRPSLSPQRSTQRQKTLGLGGGGFPKVRVLAFIWDLCESSNLEMLRGQNYGHVPFIRMYQRSAPRFASHVLLASLMSSLINGHSFSMS